VWRIKGEPRALDTFPDGRDWETGWAVDLETIEALDETKVTVLVGLTRTAARSADISPDSSDAIRSIGKSAVERHLHEMQLPRYIVIESNGLTPIY